MSRSASPIPRQPIPQLSVPLIDGGHWSVNNMGDKPFTLLLFYRGWHCPICRDQLREAQSRLYDFDRLGVSVVALSCDSKERADSTVKDWMLDRLTVGYDLAHQNAQEWGLYISTMRGKTSLGIEEPEKFSEPGVFLVSSDKTLYSATIQSAPFARPRIDDLLRGIEFVTRNNYPALGEVTLA